MNKQKTFIGIRITIWICLFLSISTICIYWNVNKYDFVSIDDNLYITENKYVNQGFSLNNIIWAFKIDDKERTYWHPVTWLSHMLDCHLYGLNPGMHHRTNLIFHVLNSLLLFIVFNSMSREVWKSAFIAAIFALHPINVESVAWIAERKNVLSTFFWLLIILFYIRYTKKTNFLRYFQVLLLFIIGLMAKPMLITIPFVLLLLDYWPIRRMSFEKIDTENKAAGYLKSPFFLLFYEKIPFFLLSACSAYISILSLKQYKNIITIETVSMQLRIANAFLSYIKYIWKIIFPVDFAFFYPYPTSLSAWQPGLSALLLLFVCFFSIQRFKKSPYLITGWFWFLGVLIPVIGIKQAGLWPAMADRWMYVPGIGIYIIITWGISDAVTNQIIKKKVLPILSIMILSVLMISTYHQVQYWEKSTKLYEHAINVTDGNYIAYYNLGTEMTFQGKNQAAIAYYIEALRIKSDYANAHINLGNLLAVKGEYKKALNHFFKALRTKPHNEQIYIGIGNILYKHNKYNKAINYYIKAINCHPKKQDVLYGIYFNLASAYMHQEEFKKAALNYFKALKIKPDDMLSHNNLGIVLASQGRYKEAASHFLYVLRIDPGNKNAKNNLKKVMMHLNVNISE